MISKLFGRHFKGPGGISALIPIAIPMIMSNIFDTIMMFVDRLYLSYVGKEHIAACMNGGLTAWTSMVFFVGVISYASALVARSYGAKNYSECPGIIHQALRLGVYAYPLVLLVGFFASKSFKLAGHDPLQTKLELIYFWYMLIGGSIITLIRAPLASFFSGIGKTSMIMKSSFVGMFINLLFNYLLIFGKCGFPKMGITGAAIGTLLANFAMTLILYYVFLKYSRKKEYKKSNARKYDRKTFVALLKYGIPSGIDMFLGTSAFNLVISIFHGYGADAAAAVTIVMNWDLLAFFPLQGVQIAVTTLVSQNLGAGRIKGAEQAAYSGFKLNIFYSLLIMLLFITASPKLVSVFTPDIAGTDYATVTSIAVPLLRWAAFYLIFDGIYLAFSGALRGGGDTFWAMIIGLCFHWFLAANVLFTVYFLKLPLMSSWLAWVLSSILGGSMIFLRFRQGRWKTIKFSDQEKENKAAIC